ncbi:MAG: hypothetical protein QOD44_66 [Solirubrobacteraceae bacterium]|jgi:hypothetical protein|nr:hypothetical protein [Solirubrobacteraceae bacterium]
MNVARLRDLFVAAPATVTVSGADDPSRPSSSSSSWRMKAPASGAATGSDVAIVCAAEDARAVGVSAAALLARRQRAPCGVACLWTPTGTAQSDSRPTAVAGARRLAAALDARGVDATGCGRAVTVTLPADPAEAVVTARRALAAAGQAPTVVVLGGPRHAALDVLLADQRRVVVLARGARAPGDHLMALAMSGLSSVAEVAVAEPIALGAAARAAAASGVAIPPALRRALSGALDRLDAPAGAAPEAWLAPA